MWKISSLIKLSKILFFAYWRLKFCLFSSFLILYFTAFPLCVWMCVLSYARIFETSWTVAHQAPLSMGFPRPKYWTGLSFPPPGDLSDPGIKPMSPALQVNSLPIEPPGSPFFHNESYIFTRKIDISFLLGQMPFIQKGKRALH